MSTALKIDFVSDVSCPWCAVGLSSLQQAIAQVGDAVDVRVHCRPFELNPQMPPGGQDIAEHLTQKYGSTPEQQAQIREVIRQRGAEVGFTFNMAGRGRIYNTFDAHRLIALAARRGRGNEARRPGFPPHHHRQRNIVAIDLAQAGLHGVEDAAGDEVFRFGEREPRRAAIHDGPHATAVGFAPSGDAEELAEGVAHARRVSETRSDGKATGEPLRREGAETQIRKAV